MSNAWETTVDDVIHVLEDAGVHVEYEISNERLEEIVDFQLDHAKVEASALYGESMDEQVQFAYEEINAQLKEIGVI